MVFTAAALGDLAGPGSTQTLLNGALRSNPGLTHRPATLWLRPLADHESHELREEEAEALEWLRALQASSAMGNCFAQHSYGSAGKRGTPGRVACAVCAPVAGASYTVNLSLTDFRTPNLKS